MDTTVKIPLTELCVINGVMINPSQFGALTSSDFIVNDTMNTLLVYMGASNVPGGPWSPYTSGLVQFGLSFRDKDIIYNIITDTTYGCHFLNNYGGHSKNVTKNIKGFIQLNLYSDTIATLNGDVYFLSHNPETKQEAHFKDANIPIYSLKEYLTLQYNRDRSVYFEPDKTYQRVHKNTKEYYEK